MRTLNEIEADYKENILSKFKRDITESGMKVLNGGATRMYAELALKKTEYVAANAEYRRAKKGAIDYIMGNHMDRPDGKPEAISRLELMIEAKVDAVTFTKHTEACMALECIDSMQDGIIVLLDFINSLPTHEQAEK